MRILLITPLYPPDIAGTAPYVKELAERLASAHTVTILTYGHIPELVPNVIIHTVEKSSLLPIRIFHFCIKLISLTRYTDIVYMQNGPSVELPMLTLSFFSRTPCIMRIGDEKSAHHSLNTPLLKNLLLMTSKRMRLLLTHSKKTLPASLQNLRLIPSPDARPEILPFSEYPKDAYERFEQSWNEHVSTLLSLFTP